MSFVESSDGTRLFYKDWGAGRPVVFVHSWSMNSDQWQYQMVDLCEHGLRCIAFDRRGHGRSGQPDGGYTYDTLADDLAALLETLDLRDVTLVGHSMGAGEVIRYLARHGSKRVARAVLLAPTTPFVLQTPDNPDGVPAEAFEFLRSQWASDFPKWLADNARPFVVPETSPEMVQWLIGLSLSCSLRAALECNRAMAGSDQRAEMRAIDVPTLIIQGDADVSVPLALTGAKSAALVPRSKLVVYQGAPHGLFITHKERLNADLLAFIAGGS